MIFQYERIGFGAIPERISLSIFYLIQNFSEYRSIPGIFGIPKRNVMISAFYYNTIGTLLPLKIIGFNWVTIMDI